MKEQKTSFWHKDSTRSVIASLLSILIGLLVGAVLILIVGVSNKSLGLKSAWEGIRLVLFGLFSTGRDASGALTFGFNPTSIGNMLFRATPLILTGLSVAVSFRTGVFTLGAEGLFVVGSIAACPVGILFDLPAPIHILLCIAAAVAAGAVWGIIVGFLKVKRGINEVLSYIMFNWIAFYLSNYIVNLSAIHRTGGGEASKDVADSARILAPEFITKLTRCTAANWGFVIAVAAAVLVWFVISKTTLGYQLRAVGFSKTAAEYGGINTNKMFLTAMAISGALAGLGGAVQTLGMAGRVSQFASQEQYGFQGITVALIGSSHPVGCIFAGLFYGAMKYGGGKLSLVKAPAEVVDIIMGIIIFFIAIAHMFKVIFNRKKGGK